MVNGRISTVYLLNLHFKICIILKKKLSVIPWIIGLSDHLQCNSILLVHNAI